MLNYEQKFKDREPLETITLIKNYFTSLGCEIKTVVMEQSKISTTWTSRIELYHDGCYLLGQNGKGTSKDYCLASAHGELYERFCNKMFYINKHPFVDKVLNTSLQKKGYYFDKDEKEITFEEAFFSSAIGKYFYESIETSENDLKDFFDTVFHNKYIGIPFYDVYNENNKLYLDPRVVSYITGSTGMAAGNNFYEAYVQGMSEIYEHYVIGRYYIEEKDKYYSINLNNINNPLLKKIIEKIQKDNILHIIDFSYNFNVPVLMSLLINKKTHSITVNLGSSPIFDIALERVITELFQSTIEPDCLKPNGQFPAIGMCDYRIRNMKWANTQNLSPIFPEFILEKLEIINNYNSNIFLSGSYSNEQLYEYLKTINNNNNFKIYYHDYSGCKDMYAIKLFSTNIPFFIQNWEYAKENINTKKVINCCKECYNLVNIYLNNQDFDIFTFMSLFELIKDLTEEEGFYFDQILYDNYLYITGQNKILFSDLLRLGKILIFHKEALIKLSNTVSKYQFNKTIYEKLNNFAIILRYLNNPNYTNEQIVNILSILQIDDINIDDFIEQLKDSKKLIKDIVFADLNNYFTGYYDIYIDMLINYNNSVLTI